MVQRKDARVSTLFVASDRREIEPWVARWDNAGPLGLPVHWARSGWHQGQQVVAVANGVGRERAAAAVQAARATGAISAIWSLGTAGALDPSLAIADIVAAATVSDGGSVWPAVIPSGPAVRLGLVRTSQHIARTSLEKANLHKTGAIIVEMEAAALAQAAQEMAVPFYCVRAVSDLANETFFIDFEAFLMPNGTFDVPRLVIYGLGHPMDAFPEMIRLQRRTSLAAKKLAGFLSECAF
jgi:adenosylhomocysteine nucleosidase